MTRIQSIYLRCRAALAWPGVLGLTILLLVSGFYVATMRPEGLRLQGLQDQLAKARRPAPTAISDATAPAGPTEQLAAFYAFLPVPGELPDLLGKLFAAATAQGLQIDTGEYRVAQESNDRLTQFHITLPVRASYPQLRKFLSAAMAQVASLSLDGIQFERQNVGESVVNARVRLTLYLGTRP
jgi:hypothetical protein